MYIAMCLYTCNYQDTCLQIFEWHNSYKTYRQSYCCRRPVHVQYLLRLCNGVCCKLLLCSMLLSTQHDCSHWRLRSEDNFRHVEYRLCHSHERRMLFTVVAAQKSKKRWSQATAFSEVVKCKRFLLGHLAFLPFRKCCLEDHEYCFTQM